MILYSGKKFTFEAFLNVGKRFGSIAFPLSINYWYTLRGFKYSILEHQLNKIVGCTNFNFTLYFLCFGISMEYEGDEE